jgi:hypothetical protein
VCLLWERVEKKFGMFIANWGYIARMVRSEVTMLGIYG